MEILEAHIKSVAPPHFDFYDSEVYVQTKLLRIEEVSELTTLGKSTINLWVAQGKFPSPTLLSPTLKVWQLAAVKSWIKSHTDGVHHD
jgi:predicted DNA-binding transcriptional regulator AlpA